MAVLSITPLISAETGEGAAGWASGSQTCSGSSPALAPNPNKASRKAVDAQPLASVTDPNGVRVQSGDYIPGIPAHNLKVGGEVEILKDFLAGANVIYASGSYLRGDDGNNQPKLDGYTTLNLAFRYAPIKHLELWGRVDNVTNARYSTAGALNFNAFAAPIAVERFVAPGAPIAGWVGAKVRF